MLAHRDSDLPRVYFVLSPSFHGSTAISLLLGANKRVFALGDTVHRPDVVTHCACGKSTKQCEFWSALSDTGTTVFPMYPEPLGRSWPLEKINNAPVGHSLVEKTRVWANGNLVELLSTCRLVWELGPRWELFRENYRKFISFCQQRKQFDVFIDGAKDAIRYLALTTIDLPTSGAIHIVRNPLAFCASSKRAGIAVKRAARDWRRTHTRIERLTDRSGKRVFKIRYEDFCKFPQNTLDKVCEYIGVERHLLPSSINQPHWLGSGSVLHYSGVITESRKWITELTQDERRVIRQQVQPLAARYGYYDPG